MNAGFNPFSIFKRADRACYSVSFKDKNGKYLPPVSTGKKRKMKLCKWLFYGCVMAFHKNRKRLGYMIYL
jgi:hypothetical protein